MRRLILIVSFVVVVSASACGSGDQFNATPAPSPPPTEGSDDATAETADKDQATTAPQAQEPTSCLHECVDRGALGPTPTPTIEPGPNPVMRGLLTQDAGNPKIWVYHIADGHGAAPWNTAATVFELKKGETFRIVNDDTSFGHGLHTNGSPCPHGGNRRVAPGGGSFGPTTSIPVGGYLECDVNISNNLDLTNGGGAQMYDHTAGQAAGVIHIKMTIN